MNTEAVEDVRCNAATKPIAADAIPSTSRDSLDGPGQAMEVDVASGSGGGKRRLESSLSLSSSLSSTDDDEDDDDARSCKKSRLSDEEADAHRRSASPMDEELEREEPIDEEDEIPSSDDDDSGNSGEKNDDDEDVDGSYSPLPTKRVPLNYIVNSIYPTLLRDDIQYYELSPPDTVRDVYAFSRFGDRFIDNMLRTAIAYNETHGILASYDLARIFLYHNEFGNVDARDMFAALKRVPLSILRGNLAFTYHSVRYIFEQYARAVESASSSDDGEDDRAVPVDTSIRRMSYYQKCALAGRPVNNWTSDECVAYMKRRVHTVAPRLCARNPPIVLFDTAGTRIFQLLKNSEYAERLADSWSLLDASHVLRAIHNCDDDDDDGSTGDSNYITFNDRLLTAFLRTAIRDDPSGDRRYTVQDILDIFLYHDSTGHLSAWKLFECLKLVSRTDITEHRLFFAECVKYVIREYIDQLANQRTARVYDVCDDVCCR